MVLGGVAQRQSYELTGPLAIPVLSQLSLDVAILGVDAFDPVRVPSTLSEAEAEINDRIAGQDPALVRELTGAGIEVIQA